MMNFKGIIFGLMVSVAGTVMAILCAVVLILLLGKGHDLYEVISLRKAVEHHTEENNLVNCGFDNNSHQDSIRRCIVDALKECKPAYAESHSDGVAWEASGGDESIEVKRNTNDECGVHYVANGERFYGPYSYDSFCKKVELTEAEVIGADNIHYLRISECENITDPQLF